MRFVQLLLSDGQVAKLKIAADMILEDEKYVLTDDEQADYARLSVFFEQVASNPAAFTPSGEMARTVKKLVRSVKGPAQPKGTAESVRNGRKARQERRQGFAKRRRSERREFAEAYNAAVAQVEAEREEMEAAQAELLAKLEAEPKFQVVNPNGAVIFDGIPESMLRRVEETVEDYPGLVVLPPGVGSA